MARILALETSCDETAAAVVEGDGTNRALVRSNTIASQVALHAEFGGVFPNLAAREHTRRIIPVISLALHEAGLTDHPMIAGQTLQTALQSIDTIAVTVGPGLIGSLLIGTAAAQELAELAEKPLIPINHWEGHLYSVFLQKPDDDQSKRREHLRSVRSKAEDSPQVKEERLPTFPILFLTVSGGHTSLILMRDHFRYEILGSTIDDAAGEAFDKCARLLGLGYPGGPALSLEAARARARDGDTPGVGRSHSPGVKEERGALKLPRPMLNSGDLRFSFSGLKTAVRYAVDRGDIDPNSASCITHHASPASRPEAAREIEDAIVDVLIGKLKAAIEHTNPASIAIVGGVSANTELRHRVTELIANRYPLIALHIPDMQYTTDNAAMIGAAGLFRYIRRQGIAPEPLSVTANASLRLGSG